MYDGEPSIVPFFTLNNQSRARWISLRSLSHPQQSFRARWISQRSLSHPQQSISGTLDLPAFPFSSPTINFGHVGPPCVPFLIPNNPFRARWTSLRSLSQPQQSISGTLDLPAFPFSTPPINFGHVGSLIIPFLAPTNQILIQQRISPKLQLLRRF